MIPFLDAIAAAGMEFVTRLGQALDEKRTGFSEYEAGDFLTAQGRMECDGPDAAQLLAEAEAENEVFEPARFCAKCDEQVGFLSSRDWCDGCEEAASIGEHPDIDPQAVIGKRRDWSGIGSPAQTPAPPGGEQPTGAPALPDGGTGGPSTTSELLTTAAHQLDVWARQLGWGPRVDYLRALIPHLHDRAAQFKAHHD